MDHLVFLKLGGSLITDKDRPHTHRPEVLARLAAEIAAARAASPDLRLLIGHGSGSFGHTAAHKYDTRHGVRDAAGWLGFAEVWREARALNQIVVEALLRAGLPVVAFPPSAFILTRDGLAAACDSAGIEAALRGGLLPLVNGDVVFDSLRGGAILSTEDVFSALAPALRPARILLAGLEEGVFADFPTCRTLIPHITPDTFRQISAGVSGSASADVTGGMREKVELMLRLVRHAPALEACIFSGRQNGLVQSALLGAAPGTRITI